MHSILGALHRKLFMLLTLHDTYIIQFSNTYVQYSQFLQTLAIDTDPLRSHKYLGNLPNVSHCIIRNVEVKWDTTHKVLAYQL